MMGREFWRPSCPEPLWVGPFLLVARCECGRRFWPNALARYKAHWRDVHELDAYGGSTSELLGEGDT
jgi:hypothetical protein